jgi:ribosomal protein S18 acetylase RimI-like enzyme
MSDRLVVTGTWPRGLTITKGWARAEARRWNDDTEAGHIRLVRGRAEFLDEATGLVSHHAGGVVYSPALFPGATRVWARAGYQPIDSLLVMERDLSSPWPDPQRSLSSHPTPDWDSLVAVDAAAFEGFWRMSATGLRESATATRRGAVLVAAEEEAPIGFAIVGAEWGSGYLQRVAVSPAHRGQGIGTDLVRASLSWARRQGSRAMVLNVRQQSTAARRLYRRVGFVETPTHLQILCHRG